ncbi:MAG: hypothetical protein E5W72_00195 [Mesorhizobium sp.]|uniref:hypothetical protein n=1 Tax=Mesorhizobium sp. TaxID=1871066 RepID=UPI00121AD665|nr:hypothetical protein [Mesorhizobium sp.]TIT01690.1 MAG: hypothetical protein E5W87_13810 [Mesorhizobium sp.]TIT55241.1 MAG: hypothetical protein E5W72_00195 [Mesorhizobium sp.]
MVFGDRFDPNAHIFPIENMGVGSTFGIERNSKGCKCTPAKSTELHNPPEEVSMPRLVAFIIALTAITTSVHASTLHEACQMMGRFAEETMKARQHGIPLQKVLDIAAKSDVEIMRKALRAMAIEAWNQSRYGTEEMQDRAIGEFRDQVQVTCLQQGGL